LSALHKPQLNFNGKFLNTDIVKIFNFCNLEISEQGAEKNIWTEER
jgi:hypothetical protein